MSTGRPHVDAQSDPRQNLELRKGRSVVTNGTKLFLAAAGIDYRSPKARRFRDLVEAYQREFEVSTESDMGLVRDAAQLTLKAEEMQAAQVRGDRVDGDEIIRLSGARRRVLADLKRRSQAGALPAPSFHEQLAANHEEHEHEGDA